MRNEFWLDGKSSLDYGVIADSVDTYRYPERDVEEVQVLGRNGTLTLDNKRFRNTRLPFDVAICEGFTDRLDAFSDWLYAAPGYRRLEDSAHPDSYRLARFAGPMEFKAALRGKMGSTRIEFDCLPQRWLKSGEKNTVLTRPGTLKNPTVYTALPVITIHGTGPGTVIINGRRVKVKAITAAKPIILDCEKQDAYSQPGQGGPEPQNHNIDAKGGFPQLDSGANAISWDGGVQSVEIIPRWWRL